MQVQTFHSSGFHLLAVARGALRLPVALGCSGFVTLLLLQSTTALAQEADTAPAVRDSFSINSAYFTNDYANNIDYAQFTLDTSTVFSMRIDNLSISNYGAIKGGDIDSAASIYRETDVDKRITAHDLVNINNRSLISGSTYTFVRSVYDFSVSGKTEVKPWTFNGFLVPNQYNYISSRGITRKWVSGYEWNDTTKLLGSYEYVVRGQSFAEPGVGIYKNFGGWDALLKVSGKTVSWANWETAFSKRLNKNWKLTATAYVWDSRSLLGERNSLKLKDNKSAQASVGVAYEY